MWKSYMIYQCNGCRYERKTDRTIYRFDEDHYHMTAYRNSPEMHESQIRAQSSPCPECGNDFFEFSRWSEC